MNNIKQLLDIIQKLRDPEDGCPWDLKQDLVSIIPHTIEEAYEVADAVEQADMLSLRDELGDLLLQVVFLSQITKEDGHFSFTDVVDAINDKLIRRHPHIFGEGEAITTADQQTESWEKIKADERKEKSRGTDSILDDVPRALPALMRASKLQKRASRVGFDWPNLEGVCDKIMEEVSELKEAIASRDKAEITAELGDVFFSLVNFSNHLKVNPEKALSQTNSKFKQRFAYIEKKLIEQGKGFDEVTLEEMDVWWEEAKTIKE